MRYVAEALEVRPRISNHSEFFADLTCSQESVQTAAVRERLFMAGIVSSQSHREAGFRCVGPCQPRSASGFGAEFTHPANCSRSAGHRRMASSDWQRTCRAIGWRPPASGAPRPCLIHPWGDLALLRGAMGRPRQCCTLPDSANHASDSAMAVQSVRMTMAPTTLALPGSQPMCSG